MNSGFGLFMAKRLSPRARQLIKSALNTVRRQRFSWGSFGDPQGIDPRVFPSGLPIALWYLRDFVIQNSSLLRGQVLELGADALVQERTGISTIDYVESLKDIDTLIADGPDVARHDCIVITAGIVENTPSAEMLLSRLWDALLPKGILLIAAHATETPGNMQSLRLITPAGLGDLLARTCANGDIYITSYGNLVTVIAAMTGIRTGHISMRQLGHFDPAFPVLSCARVTKAAL